MTNKIYPFEWFLDSYQDRAKNLYGLLESWLDLYPMNSDGSFDIEYMRDAFQITAVVGVFDDFIKKSKGIFDKPLASELLIKQLNLKLEDFLQLDGGFYLKDESKFGGDIIKITAHYQRFNKFHLLEKFKRNLKDEKSIFDILKYLIYKDNEHLNKYFEIENEVEFTDLTSFFTL